MSAPLKGCPLPGWLHPRRGPLCITIERSIWMPIDSFGYRIKNNKPPMYQKYSLCAPWAIEVFASDDCQGKMYVSSWMTISLEPSKVVDIVPVSIAQSFGANINTTFQHVTLDIRFRMCSSIFRISLAPLPSPSTVDDLQSTIHRQFSSNFSILCSKPDCTVCTRFSQFLCNSECS
jgi:hypothetical protein